VVGISRALDWTMSGRLLPAAEALAGNLVSRVVAPEALLATAQAAALEIAENSAPVSVALTRQMMWRLLGAEHPIEAHRIESLAIAARGASADAREGVAAFMEKRPPRFPCKVGSDMPALYPWWDEPPFNAETHRA
jgi:enoyl-CoA hydratase/carnithine racemase